MSEMVIFDSLRYAMEDIASVELGWDYELQPPEWRVWVVAGGGRKSYPATPQNMLAYHEWHVLSLRARIALDSGTQVEISPKLASAAHVKERSASIRDKFLGSSGETALKTSEGSPP